MQMMITNDYEHHYLPYDASSDNLTRWWDTTDPARISLNGNKVTSNLDQFASVGLSQSSDSLRPTTLGTMYGRQTFQSVGGSRRLEDPASEADYKYLHIDSTRHLHRNHRGKHYR